LKEILENMRMVAEGVRTAKALWELAQKQRVDMPLSGEVYKILYEGKNPREAVQGLLSRLPRSEREDLPEGSLSF